MAAVVGLFRGENKEEEEEGIRREDCVRGVKENKERRGRRDLRVRERGAEEVIQPLVNCGFATYYKSGY